MAEMAKIEMTTEEWGQVMIVLQGGVYRVVAPLLQKINNQLIEQMRPGPRLVEPADQQPESAAE